MTFLFDYNPFEVEICEGDRLTGLISFVLDNFDTGTGKLAPFTEYLYHLLNNATEKEEGVKYFTEEGIHIGRRMDMVDEWAVWFENAFDRGWMW